MTIRFDDAWRASRRIAYAISDTGVDVVLIRNLRGMISVLVGDPDIAPADAELERLEQELREAAGLFCGRKPVLRWADLSAPSILAEESPSRTVVRSGDGEVGRLVVVERTVVGAEWSRVSGDPPGRRVTLYGFKGGVGRSTATVLLARHLATAGQCVLVVDLDLESPGVGALLVDEQQLPEHGIIDHLAEAAVGNSDGLDLVVRSSVVPVSGNGEVWIAPAAGRPRDGYEYLPKLNRAYLDAPPFAVRLNDAVSACEARVASLSRPPDVVLLDSRAGLHDIAAVAMTQLSDVSLLFAVNNPHTWAGYGELFRQWGADSERAREIRHRLKMVATGVPSARSSYLADFRDRAQASLAELYDDVVGEGLEKYNPALEDKDAPHSPLPITFLAGLVGLDAAANREWLEDAQVGVAFAEFVTGAADLIERSFS